MNKGFTLVELLVVIAILAVLMATAVVALNPAARIKDAQNNSVKQVVRNIGIGMEACQAYVNSSGIANAYTDCDSTGELKTSAPGGPFIKDAPTGATLKFTTNSTAKSVCVEYQMGSSVTFSYNTADAKVTEAACPASS